MARHRNGLLLGSEPVVQKRGEGGDSSVSRVLAECLRSLELDPESGTVVHFCNPSILDLEAGG